jgi:dihydroorotate dehydrogenase (NAD+) catalytic subunit
MESQDETFRWSELLRELVSYSNQTQFARTMGFSEREVSRWIKGRAKPNGHSIAALLKECEKRGINFKKYRGLKPVYDFHVTLDRNVMDGPQDFPFANLRVEKIPSSFLGYHLNSPLGVPASVLTLNSNWIEPLAGIGWDVITAKTVRTGAEVPHPMPNWVYLPGLREPMLEDALVTSIEATTDVPDINIAELSAANSFGMPSSSILEWQADLRATKALLKSGQILIASVVGTAQEGKPDVEKSLVDDFVACAKFAAETEPHAIELNFSCPNVYGKEGSIFHNAALAGRICRIIRKNLPDAKILVKIGYLNAEDLQEFFDATYKYVDGYTAINTFSTKIVTTGQREEPAFPGPKRSTGGVSGAAIRNIALATVRRLRAMAVERKPELQIIGVGGISSAEHVKLFEEAGANVVQICTAALFDPFIVVEIRKQLAHERNPGNYSPALEKSGHHVSFQDQHSKETFETVILVAEKMDVPFDVVYSIVYKNWLGDYLKELALLKSSAPQARTRLSSPTEDQIERWVKDELSRGQ